MNESTEVAEITRTPYDLIERAKTQFQKIAKHEGLGINYEKESVFAYQALTKNDFTESIAMKNPASVVNAVINIASVGLSLNPATSYAYLVPRDGAICLDISYQGLIKIATDSGSIKWAKADLVYENDEFKYKGPAKAPKHIADPFQKDRGAIKGVYCIAKTVDDDILVEAMHIDEIMQIMNESASIKHAKSEYAKAQSPWTRYFGEMAKKSCIKRASKTWPKTKQGERIQKAIDIIHETEGSDWEEFTDEEKKKFKQYVEEENGIKLLEISAKDTQRFDSLFRAVKDDIPRGKKGEFKEATQLLLSKTEQMIFHYKDLVIEALSNDDKDALYDLYADLDETEKFLLRKTLSLLQIEQVNQMLEES